MKGKSLAGLCVLIMTTLLVSCAAPTAKKAPMLFTPQDLNPQLQSREYEPKVDNFMVILDASGTMREPYKGYTKLDFAKGLVSGMFKTIPGMTLTGGLRMFGSKSVTSTKLTEILYGPAAYSLAKFEDALATITEARGDSPLNLAIDAASEDLKSIQGKIALLIFSDGKNMGEAPLKSAKAIKSRFGENLCIYTVLIGDDPGGKKLLEEIAKAGECGFSVTGDSIGSAESMADFVESVFLSKGKDSDGDGVLDFRDQCPDTPKGVKVDVNGCPLDTDGDGVYDYLDKCPSTPKGVAVTKEGCPLDSDGDGVLDYKDNCPNTPSGVQVDDAGCPLDTDGDGVYDYLDRCPDTPKGATVNKVGCWVLKGVNFDYDRWDIKPQYYPILDEVISVLKRNPSLKVEIQGHTDSQGPAAYNQKLSENRAKAVMEYFVKRGIDRGRLSAVGYGLTRPVASNLTREGRAQNRRVELQPIH